MVEHGSYEPRVVGSSPTLSKTIRLETANRSHMLTKSHFFLINRGFIRLDGVGLRNADGGKVLINIIVPEQRYLTPICIDARVAQLVRACDC